MKQKSSQTEIMTLNDLTKKQWTEIKKIAQVLVDQEAHESNHIKCTIFAFVAWLSQQDFDLAIPIDSDETRHEIH